MIQGGGHHVQVLNLGFLVLNLVCPLSTLVCLVVGGWEWKIEESWTAAEMASATV